MKMPLFDRQTGLFAVLFHQHIQHAAPDWMRMPDGSSKKERAGFKAAHAEVRLDCLDFPLGQFLLRRVSALQSTDNRYRRLPFERIYSYFNSPTSEAFGGGLRERLTWNVSRNVGAGTTARKRSFGQGGGRIGGRPPAVDFSFMTAKTGDFRCNKSPSQSGLI